MVNSCEAGAGEPRGDMLARWHAAKQRHHFQVAGGGPRWRVAGL